MLRSLMVIAASAAMFLGFAPVAAGSDSCASHGIGADAHASSCGELGWSYDPQTKRFGFGSKITATDDPDGSKFVYQLVSACDASADGGAGNSVCANFGNCPPRVGPDGEPLRAARFQGLRGPKGANGQLAGDMQPYGEAICVYQGRSVPMADVVAAVRDQLVRQVGRPQIRVQPATVGLIHFPVLFHAPQQRLTALRITRPLTGAITATPAYTWDLGEGQTARGAGHPYQRSIDPTDPASDRYYVTARYNGTGAHVVTLTLTWQAVIHLGPAAGGLDVDLDPITFTDRATARTVAAVNHLYSEVPD